MFPSSIWLQIYTVFLEMSCLQVEVCINWMCVFFVKCRLRMSASHVDTVWQSLTCPTLESSISLDQMPRRRLIGCSLLMSTKSQVSLLQQEHAHTFIHTHIHRQMGEKIDRMKRADSRTANI